jgi:hypothetical protein
MLRRMKEKHQTASVSLMEITVTDRIAPLTQESSSSVTHSTAEDRHHNVEWHNVRQTA